MLANGEDIRGYIDIICGGFPCQDISVGGKRTGITGSRSSLWKYMCNAVRVVRPIYVLVENVAALCRRGLGTVAGDLAEIGYDTQWHCIPASAVGCLHERDRIWVIGYPDSSDAGDKIALQLYNSEKWKTEKGTQDWQNMLNELGAGNVAQRTDTYAGALRVLDGISDRSHRCKALGNSLVPRIAEIIGRTLNN